MLLAHKKIRVIRIPDEKAEEYKNIGYRITTMDGQTVYEPVDKDKKSNALEAENAILKQRIAELNLLLESANGGAVQPGEPAEPDDTVGEDAAADKDKGSKSAKGK